MSIHPSPIIGAGRCCQLYKLLLLLLVTDRMNIMPKISKVSDRIPKFVRDYPNLKDSDELQWDQGAEGNMRFFRLLKRGYNALVALIFL
jgi:hypothetical protein